MALIRTFFAGLLLILVTGSCTSVQHISKTEVRYISVNPTIDVATDDKIDAMIAPYRESLEEEMNETVGQVGIDLSKNKPESTLGNWYVDAMMNSAARKGYIADLGVSNYGGLRIPVITAGPLTRGELYELSPFDNLLVIVEVPGTILDTLMQMMATAEGWPVSSEVRMTFHNNQVTSCTIKGEPIDPGRIYKVAMPDYVANGGDGCKMLIPLSRVQTGLLVRDLLIEDAQATAARGETIRPRIEGRIVKQ